MNKSTMGEGERQRLGTVSFGGNTDETTGNSAEVLKASAHFTRLPAHRQPVPQNCWVYTPKQRERRGDPGRPKGTR